jgi:hypothetical protein
MILNRGPPVLRRILFVSQPSFPSLSPSIASFSPPVRTMGQLAQRTKRKPKKASSTIPDNQLSRQKMAKFVQQERNRLTKKVNWREVDLSLVQPTPRSAEPELHREDGKTYFKHPKRYNLLNHAENPSQILFTHGIR